MNAIAKVNDDQRNNPPGATETISVCVDSGDYTVLVHHWENGFWLEFPDFPSLGGNGSLEHDPKVEAEAAIAWALKNRDWVNA